MKEKSDMDFRSVQQIELESKFENLIDAIDLKHTAYFSARKSIIPSENKDTIRNHYVYRFTNGVASVNFRNDSDIEQDIKDEVYDAFRQSFPMR